MYLTLKEEEKYKTGVLDLLSKMSDLSAGKTTVEDVVNSILTPPMKENNLNQVLEQFQKTSEFGKMKELAEIQTGQEKSGELEDLQSFLQKSIESTQAQTVDPIFLENLVKLYQLGQYGIPISKITTVSPQATTQYQQTLTELSNQLAKLTSQAAPVIENPPTKETPSYLPFLGLLSAVGAIVGGAKGALPFLALGAALKRSAENAYQSELNASKLVLGGIEEARHLTTQRFLIEREKYQEEKEKIQRLDNILSTLDSNAVSNILSKFTSNLKESGDIILSLDKLKPEERAVLLGTNTGRAIIDRANSQALFKMSDTLQKERMLLSHQLQMIRQQTERKASETRDLEKFISDPKGSFIRDAQKVVEYMRINFPIKRPDIGDQIIGGELNQPISELFGRNPDLIADQLKAHIQTALSSYEGTSSTSNLQKVLQQINLMKNLTEDQKKEFLTAMINAWELGAINQLAPFFYNNWINQTGKPYRDQPIPQNKLDEIKSLIEDEYLKFWGMLLRGVSEEELKKKAEAFARAFVERLSQHSYSIPTPSEKKKEQEAQKKKEGEKEEKILIKNLLIQ